MKRRKSKPGKETSSRFRKMLLTSLDIGTFIDCINFCHLQVFQKVDSRTESERGLLKLNHAERYLTRTFHLKVVRTYHTTEPQNNYRRTEVDGKLQFPMNHQRRKGRPILVTNEAVLLYLFCGFFGSTETNSEQQHFSEDTEEV